MKMWREGRGKLRGAQWRSIPDADGSSLVERRLERWCLEPSKRLSV